jgi:hypothetical protein
MLIGVSRLQGENGILSNPIVRAGVGPVDRCNAYSTGWYIPRMTARLALTLSAVADRRRRVHRSMARPRVGGLAQRLRIAA